MTPQAFKCRFRGTKNDSFFGRHYVFIKYRNFHPHSYHFLLLMKFDSCTGLGIVSKLANYYLSFVIFIQFFSLGLNSINWCTCRTFSRSHSRKILFHEYYIFNSLFRIILKVCILRNIPSELFQTLLPIRNCSVFLTIYTGLQHYYKTKNKFPFFLIKKFQVFRLQI